MSFKLVTGDLIRLVETPREKINEQLENVGGLEGVAAALHVDLHQGLDAKNADDLRNREDFFGKNYIPPPKAKSFLELMWDAFQDITIIILTISVTLVTAVNDYQKEQQFRSLNAVKEDEKIKVIRNGAPTEVSKWNLLVGDIVRVDLGDIIPADGMVFDEKELKMDESAMTGESDLLTKNRDNPFLLSGTKVMEGLGKMLVVCVGENSQAGVIKSLINGTRTVGNTSTPKAEVKNNVDHSQATDDIYVEIDTPKVPADEDDNSKEID
ncbi:Calcium-translocating P-type ATPase, PMCA-type, partial [Phytophthora palmivora]